jgi:formylmethanofuran:tetrahydromethanopterin formyltransferase
VVASPAAAAADLGFRAQTGFTEGMGEFAHAALREPALAGTARRLDPRGAPDGRPTGS